MIRFSLHCDQAHDFEGWFRSNDDFDTQKKRGFVECPSCGSSKVEKALMAPAVSTGRKKEKMALAMGVNIKLLFTLVFGAGAALCAVAGAMLAPLFAVQVGMGENILILAFVVIVIGGIGSIRGAFVGALLVGLVDTMGRALLPMVFYGLFPPMVASSLGPAVSSIMIYVLMAGVLFFRPQGLFGRRTA